MNLVLTLLLWYFYSVVYAHILIGLLRFTMPDCFYKGDINCVIAALYLPVWNVLCPTVMIVLSLVEKFMTYVPDMFVKFYHWLYQTRE